jgi:SEC-C motif-containing protein
MSTPDDSEPISGACPCGSGYPLVSCCAPYIAGIAPAPDALALMRSRYTAYTLGKAAYLRATWYPATRPGALDLEPGRRWLGLKILDTVAGRSGDATGTVEFVARFKVGGRAHRLHERSRFVFEDGRWYYVDGEIARGRA